MQLIVNNQIQKQVIETNEVVNKAISSFIEANKSSYIDSNLERNVNAYEFINMLGNSIKNNETNWHLHN